MSKSTFTKFLNPRLKNYFPLLFFYFVLKSSLLIAKHKISFHFFVMSAWQKRPSITRWKMKKKKENPVRDELQ